MPAKREKLTDASLQLLLDKIKKDAQLRTEMIEKIQKNGVMPVVNDFFVLSDKQNGNVSNLNPSNPMEKHLSAALVAALQTGGTIRLVPPDTNLIQPQGAGVSIGVHQGPDGTDLNVDIHCVQ
jgi:hypothetical protein